MRAHQHNGHPIGRVEPEMIEDGYAVPLARVRRRSPLFETGDVYATIGATRHRDEYGTDLGTLVTRHISGDYGDLTPEDREENDRAVREGGRVVSSYVIGPDRLLVITEANRRITTIMLQGEC